jgi:hypothetical protein
MNRFMFGEMLESSATRDCVPATDATRDPRLDSDPQVLAGLAARGRGWMAARSRGGMPAPGRGGVAARGGGWIAARGRG